MITLLIFSSIRFFELCLDIYIFSGRHGFLFFLPDICFTCSKKKDQWLKGFKRPKQTKMVKSSL